jgi:hypothetical protein
VLFYVVVDLDLVLQPDFVIGAGEGVPEMGAAAS